MPWILLGGVTLVIFNVMLFAPVKNFSQWGKYAWCLVSYCLWSIAYTMVNVPYGSLHSVITDNPQEKVSLSTFRSIGAALPAIVIMIVLPRIVYNTSVNAAGEEIQTLKGETLLPVAIVLSIVALVVLWGTTKLVKERVPGQGFLHRHWQRKGISCCHLPGQLHAAYRSGDKISHCCPPNCRSLG